MEIWVVPRSICPSLASEKINLRGMGFFDYYCESKPVNDGGEDDERKT